MLWKFIQTENNDKLVPFNHENNENDYKFNRVHFQILINTIFILHLIEGTCMYISHFYIVRRKQPIGILQIKFQYCHLYDEYESQWVIKFCFSGQFDLKTVYEYYTIEFSLWWFSYTRRMLLTDPKAKGVLFLVKTFIFIQKCNLRYYQMSYALFYNKLHDKALFYNG